MNVLLIKNGTVENCISADSLQRAQQFYPEHLCIERIEALSAVGPGHSYNGETFVAPERPAVEATSLTRLEFLRRIPAEKRIAIRAAAETDPIIEDALMLLDLAMEVRTDDPDTMMLVGYLLQQEYLTANEVAVILS